MTREESSSVAFADPQTVTINAVAQTLNRVSSDHNAGTFRKDDGTVSLIVSHQYGKRARHVVRLNHQKYSPDVFVPANQALQNMSVQLVVDVPIVGYTNAEAKQVTDGFSTFITASSGLVVTRLLSGEN